MVLKSLSISLLFVAAASSVVSARPVIHDATKEGDLTVTYKRNGQVVYAFGHETDVCYKLTTSSEDGPFFVTNTSRGTALVCYEQDNCQGTEDYNLGLVEHKTVKSYKFKPFHGYFRNG